MKILVASDLHGSKEASLKLVSLDEKMNFDKIILLGDIGYSGARNIPPRDYSPLDLYQNLSKIRSKLIVIRGNCDSRVDEMVLETKFYDLLEIDFEEYKFHMTHGDIYDENSFKYSNRDLYLYGHTHVSVLENRNDHITLNPGSMSLPKGNLVKSYAIIDLDIKVIELKDLEDNTIKELSL